MPTKKLRLPRREFCWPLCFFLGYLGVHRFYVGKVGTGILQLFTVGGFGISALIDFVTIVTGGFRDKQDNKIAHSGREVLAECLLNM
jgi:TM2 domain-containing membrane protein YozV